MAEELAIITVLCKGARDPIIEELRQRIYTLENEKKTLEKEKKEAMNVIYINRSSRKWLEKLKHVGKALSWHIDFQRQYYGPFTNYDNLICRVAGIGPKIKENGDRVSFVN